MGVVFTLHFFQEFTGTHKIPCSTIFHASKWCVARARPSGEPMLLMGSSILFRRIPGTRKVCSSLEVEGLRSVLSVGFGMEGSLRKIFITALTPNILSRMSFSLREGEERRMIGTCGRVDFVPIGGPTSQITL